MVSKTYDQWKYETFEKLGTQTEAISRITWDAAIKSLKAEIAALADEVAGWTRDGVAIDPYRLIDRLRQLLGE